MKRGTPRHPKVEDLCIRLNIPKYSAVGILEMLWHFTAEFCLAGDIGRFSDEAIAKALCWDHASTMLVSALVESRWLDRCKCHRLRIHDWKDHADQTVRRVLAKRHQDFLPCYDDPSTVLASSQHETSQPLPLPLPLPKANSLKPPAGQSQKPTEEEVVACCVSNDLPESDGHYLFHHWEGNGWTNNGEKIKKWRSVIASWKKAGYMPSQKAAGPIKTIAAQKQDAFTAGGDEADRRYVEYGRTL